MKANSVQAMREVLNRVHDYLGELIRDNLVEDTPRASDLADDVYDAIHGSHPTTEKSSVVGNAARLREAVVLALSLLDLKEGVPFKTVSQKDIDFMKAALAAPPRNCDMPLVVDGPADNNADKAWLVFKQHNHDAYFDVPGLLRCIDWLLALAVEWKGESNEHK